jgi:crotonobetainyl-CoA:carnitine CoA-transferase CaiB-like acyl-CoA transferase
MNSSTPLEKLKIIDLSTVLAGPSVGTFFAELGAEVTKVEHPVKTDVTRTWRLPNEENSSLISAYFSSVNYKKNYRFLDFTKEEEREQLFEMIKDADIVLMNFKKGGQEKLGISDEQLKKYNPQLIIGKISGFGDDSDRVAYDLILQAESGFMSMNGTPESGPLKMPVALIDVLAAHHLKEGLLIALLQKSIDQHFKGRIVSVSLYDAAISSLINQASNYLMAGQIPSRIGSLHPNIAPYGELFITKDGGQITFAIGSNRHFELLCNWLNRKDLLNDKRFHSAQTRVKYRTVLFKELQFSINQFEAQEILDGMLALNVPCAKIKNLQEVFKSASAKKLIRNEEINGVPTIRVSGVGFKISES